VRQSRFASLADDKADRIGALSPLEVLFFDLLPATRSGMDRIAMERVRSLAFAGPYLAAAHLICALVLMIDEAGRQADPGTLVPLGGVAVIALLPGLLVGRQHRLGVRPHVVVRFWAAFLLAIGALWCVIIPNELGQGGMPSVAYGALAGAFCLSIGSFLFIPSLLLASYFSATIAFLMISSDRTLLPLLFVFGGCLVGASVFSSRGVLFSSVRRLSAETRALKASRLVAEFEQSGRGWFWETDAGGALTYVSSKLAEELGGSPADLEGMPFSNLMASEVTDTVDGLERTLGFHLSTRLSFSDLAVRARTDEDIWWSLSGTPNFDEYGRYLGFSGIGTDLTEKRRSEAEINKLARYDALTGLPNRTLMRMTLDDALRSIDKQRRGCALFLIDLDRFKNVNDTLGHPVGDALLRQVSDRLRSVIGSDGQVGRLGGDEFKAVLPAIDTESRLSVLARRLIEQVSMPYLIEGNNITIGASVGIAIATASDASADALIRDADLALYAAKDDGRGTFRIFAPDMHSEAKERQALEAELRHALANDQLKLVYQPIVHAVTEEVLGFEALCRWLHPTRGYVPTERFIALAEECGLILSIGDWVLRTACAEAAGWPGQVRVAVNISPIQFANPHLVTTVMGALSSSGLAPERLELEVTESVFLSGGKATDAMFGKLKAAGVRLALDDFGTGYSSLGYLKKAPFDKIKIDQSFVRGAANGDNTNRAILRSIITLADNLDMDTTAEGVETHDDLALIRELGCSQVQGYIFGRPVDALAARELASTAGVQAEGYETTRPPRFTLLRFANLQWNGMTFPVRLRNVSTGGALLVSDRGLPPGALVQLDLVGCGSFGAEVRWTSDSCLGLRFERPFDVARLSAAGGKGVGRSVIRPAYLDSELSPESPWAGRTDRLSPRDVGRG
jgi:diguanylate cyclase (GGDEF)-like protein/PAS domain S-box-containing protein